MITLSKAFVISTQFRETPSTIRRTGTLSRLKIYKVPLMKFPASPSSTSKKGQWTGNDKGEWEDRAASIFCIFRVRYTYFLRGVVIARQ